MGCTIKSVERILELLKKEQRPLSRNYAATQLKLPFSSVTAAFSFLEDHKLIEKIQTSRGMVISIKDIEKAGQNNGTKL